MALLGLGCGQEALKAVALTGGPTGTGVWPGYWDWGVARILGLGCDQEALKTVALTAQSPRPLFSSIMMFS